jgi:hypothetical protein
MRSIVLMLAVSANAVAAPPAKLSRDELLKISAARQAALPPVDKTKAARCQRFLDAYNKDPAHGDDQAVQAARCLQDAGAIAAAIQQWQLVMKYQPTKPAAKEATRELGGLYERAALFDSAAEWDESYWGHYASDADARQKLVRATCIRFQLGDGATRDLTRLRSGTKPIDANTLCDAIHPIEMP